MTVNSSKKRKKHYLSEEEWKNIIDNYKEEKLKLPRHNSPRFNWKLVVRKKGKTYNVKSVYMISERLKIKRSPTDAELASGIDF